LLRSQVALKFSPPLSERLLVALVAFLTAGCTKARTKRQSRAGKRPVAGRGDIIAKLCQPG
jgi:hypothetical protein